MFDQIEQLEGRVNALVQLLEQTRGELDRLRKENREHARKLEAQAKIEEENLQLEEQIQALQRQIEDMSGRESQMRDRLQGVLSRIDSLEQEVQRGVEQ